MTDHYSIIRALATEDARRWLDRHAMEATFGRKDTGVAEACPKCWKPIFVSGWSTMTGHPSCSCGTEPLYKGGRAGTRTAAHGLESIAGLFVEYSPPRVRPD